MLKDALTYGATVSAYGLYSGCAAALAAPTIVAAPAVVTAGLVVGAVSFGAIGVYSAIAGIVKVTQGLGLK